MASLPIPVADLADTRSPGSRSAMRAFRLNLWIVLVVWTFWLIFGGHHALHHLLSNWKIALTMVFGSLLGGGSSQGGGAVAFPVFTKLLHIAPYDARNFSLAIQSVGMGAASLCILLLRIPIERRTLLYAGLPGIAGVTFGAYYIAPYVPPVIVRTSFTVLVTTLGLALLILNRDRGAGRNLRMSALGGKEQVVLMAAGFLGGIVSALVGTGENSVTFMVMVLLFRINEKIATPTTVVLMTMTTIPGFLIHLLWFRDFSPVVMGYWLAAIPVVALFGPLGALICLRMSRRAIVNLLLVLIVLEFVSTLALIPISRGVLLASAISLLVCGSLDWLMSRVTLYAPLPTSQEARD